MENLTLVQKRLVNAYAILVLANREPNIPEELQKYVDIRVAEIEIEKLSKTHQDINATKRKKAGD